MRRCTGRWKGDDNMKKIHFDIETAGFYGAYWKNPNPSDAAIIAMIGDDPEDYLARKCAAWLQKKGLNVMTMSPAKKDYGHHNYPLERIETAANWLLANGNSKVGIIGASTTGMLALVAASYFPQITMTIALTPSDFVWQGFMQGKKDGCEEWPVPGESTISYQGVPLPYMPFVYQHPDYWHMIEEDTKGSGDMIRSRKLFDDSEAAHPLTEDEMIKVENIHGVLLLVGAEDDGLWDTCRYIRRMDERLKSRPHLCRYKVLTYKHGTHFVFPESLIRSLVPGSKFILGLCFRDAKRYPDACRRTRIDIDIKVSRLIQIWLREGK